MHLYCNQNKCAGVLELVEHFERPDVPAGTGPVYVDGQLTPGPSWRCSECGVIDEARTVEARKEWAVRKAAMREGAEAAKRHEEQARLEALKSESTEAQVRADVLRRQAERAQREADEKYQTAIDAGAVSRPVVKGKK